MERIKTHDGQLRTSGLNIRIGDAMGWTEARYGSSLMVTSADLVTLTERQWIGSIVSAANCSTVFAADLLLYVFCSIHIQIKVLDAFLLSVREAHPATRDHFYLLDSSSMTAICEGTFPALREVSIEFTPLRDKCHTFCQPNSRSVDINNLDISQDITVRASNVHRL
jgi:hypothetical protein